MEFRGIDISKHNGIIDFDKIKEQNLFCLIRVAYGSYGIDAKGKYNMEECQKRGIPFGAYVYSYARNTGEARSEAANVLEQVKGFNLSYPLIIDMEDADGYKKKNGVSYKTCIDICKIECEEFEKAGYYAMIYANKDWLENKINSADLDRYDKWLAQWNNKPTYGKPFGIWQYTSDGKVDGINGRVDMNIAYKDYPSIIANMNKPEKPVEVIEEVTVKVNTSLNIREGAGTNYNKIGSYYNGDVVSILEVKGNWGRTVKGWICLDYTTSKYAGNTQSSPEYSYGIYRVTTPKGLNIRTGAGTGYSKVGAYRYGEVVEVEEIKNNWGRTVKGWICLDYTKRKDG